MRRALNPRTVRAMRAAEAEHNAGCDYREIFYEIVAGYAAMGYPQIDVALCVGIDPRTMGRVLRHLDPDGAIQWRQDGRAA